MNLFLNEIQQTIGAPMSACEAYQGNAKQQLHIQLGEHFDFRSIHSFRQYSKEQFAKETEVVVDMQSTRYIDSSGVALLLCLFQWVHAPHVTVSAINCNPAIKHILLMSQCGDKVIIN
jgi:anti-anti-sigma factor